MQRTISLAHAVALAGFAAFALSTGPASAQDSGARNRPTKISTRLGPRPRITVTPSQRVYRQCVDVYVVERRLTGDTVVPNMRCWWTYR